MSLKTDIYKTHREWPYKNVPHRILAEELIENNKDGELKDYKFFCFNGKPRFLKVDFGRYSEHHANYYDLNWNLLPFGESEFPYIEAHIEKKPLNFNKMVSIAQQLSKGHKFLRVDLYNVDGKIYFGEITFFPASGLSKYEPAEYDYKLLQMVEL